MMVHSKISDRISAINNFYAMSNNSDFHFFLINKTQLSLLEALHYFKTLRMQEKFIPI